MADYDCDKCGTPHDTEYSPNKYGLEKHDVNCLKCGHRMGTDNVFGMRLRIHRPEQEPGAWEIVPPR